MGEHWRIAGVYSADSVMTPVRVAIWEGHRRFLCAVPQEIAEQIVEAANDRARLLGEVERLRRELMQWEEFDFERDNPKRLVEHTLALMVERDKAQALAASLSEELHRLGKDNQRLRAALALAATPAVAPGASDAGETQSDR